MRKAGACKVEMEMFGSGSLLEAQKLSVLRLAFFCHTANSAVLNSNGMA